MRILNFLRGALFGAMCLLSSYLGIVFMPGWFLPLAFVQPNWYRRITDFCLGWWFWLVAAMMEHLFQIKMVITGDELQAGERSILIMNHRSRLDWMYFWSILVRQSGASTEKIILKYPLKHIPGAGWAMQCGGFLFLKRRWEEDKTYMKDMIDYYGFLKHKSQILLFPEGTDFCEESKARSDDFARKNNLTPYEYVLHPRITGFSWLADYMKNHQLVDTIYDITVGYPYGFPHTEFELMAGDIPREVHFHIQRIDVNTLPGSEDALQDWCRERWRLKEEQLKKFYEEKKFAGAVRTNPASRREDMVGWMLKMAFVYWTIFVVAMLYLLLISSLARWMFLLQTIFFIGMSLRGGFERFQARWTLQRFSKGSKSS